MTCDGGALSEDEASAGGVVGPGLDADVTVVPDEAVVVVEHPDDGEVGGGLVDDCGERGSAHRSGG